MHTESQLRRIAKTLLEKYGKLSTHEVILLMEKYVKFDSEDLTPNPNRKFKKRFPDGEPLVYQRIRNIALRDKKVFDEGFIIRKVGKTTYWIATTGFTGREKEVSKDLITKKREHLDNDKKKSSKRRGTKVDWSIINERNTDLGARGEEFVHQYELDRVREFAPDSLDKVIHSSVSEGDGLGYDVLSLNKKGQTIYIEVKTTKGALETPFYLSINEKEFLEENENAYLYRVYEFDENSRSGLIKIISSKKFFKEYNLDPVSFKVTKK